MTGSALLFATLIGVFITPDGIVVGADTALSTRAGRHSTRQKYCVTGPRTVATLQGVYELTDTETKATVALYDYFLEFCAKADRSAFPATIQGKAEYIAEALRAALTDFLEDVPAAEVVSKYASNRVVARVSVAGYDDQGAASAVVGLGVAVDVPTSRWDVQVRDLSRLTFRECGVRFHGQDVVVQALRRSTDARVPARDRQRPDVEKLSALIGGSCSDVSTRSVQRMFTEAARLTMTLGSQFGIEPGVVDLPVDIIVIPASGEIQVSRIESW